MVLRAGWSVATKKMSWPISRNTMERDEQVTRPKRQTRQPLYLEDFNVEYASKQRASHYDRQEAVRYRELSEMTPLNTEANYPFSSQHPQHFEGPARMTPLPTYGFTSDRMTPVHTNPAQDDVVLAAIKEIRQENRQLQENMLRLTEVISKLQQSPPARLQEQQPSSTITRSEATEAMDGAASLYGAASLHQPDSECDVISQLDWNQQEEEKEKTQKVAQTTVSEPPLIPKQSPLHYDDDKHDSSQYVSKGVASMSLLNKDLPRQSFSRLQQYQPTGDTSNPAHYNARQNPSDIGDVYDSQDQRQYHDDFAHRLSEREKMYRGPKPTIPSFVRDDPREFSRLKLALDNLLPVDATERFKYQILVDHLKLEDALLIADSYSNSYFPYSDTMAALTAQYGQPHQLALKRIAELMDGPSIKDGDTVSFRRFALRVRALVGMLDQLGQSGKIELNCGSHVTRLTSKLPHALRTDFRRYALSQQIRVPTLYDFSDWLEVEVQVQESEAEMTSVRERSVRQRERYQDKRTNPKSSTVLLNTHHSPASVAAPLLTIPNSTEPGTTYQKNKVYCSYCSNNQHYLNQCINFGNLTKEQKEAWIRRNRKCWRCGRNHQAAQCTLKAKCKACGGRHVDALHELNVRPAKEDTNPSSSSGEVLYVDRPTASSRVFLKLSKVILHNGKHKMETFAVLDDGSERTILLPAAAKELKLHGEPENLALKTVRQDIRVIRGQSVSFTISPASQPNKIYNIKGAFTAEHLGLAEHSHPIETLQSKYPHLRNLPLNSFHQVKPLLLIGSDYPHLITPIEPVRLGPPGGPAAIKTRLGWTLQGPASAVKDQLSTQVQCLFTSTLSPGSDLLRNVQQLWQLDVLPFRNEKAVTRSQQDQHAIRLLEEKTVRVNIDGTQRYATPLLRTCDMPTLHAPKETVLGLLRSTERRLVKDSKRVEIYNGEISKLEKTGYVTKLEPEAVLHTAEAWYIPHHMVEHNGKQRIVFNCSFTYEKQSLNDHLLPGPPLGPTLLGVLLRFRQHHIAISSDIKGMFHQVRLLPDDKPLLRFLWRDVNMEKPPDVFEWQVLPFGTTCSPCCAVYALQRHTKENTKPADETRSVVENSFYVDNCLYSLNSIKEATELVDKLRSLLFSGGFELRQWASNVPDVIKHLPEEAKSGNNEQWLAQNNLQQQEMTLGLRWHCERDELGYRYRAVPNNKPTMRYIYKVLAKQYDPLGFIIPFTTRAKIIVRHLWDKCREWDDPHLPDDLLQAWCKWEKELEYLSLVTIPRCYGSPEMDTEDSNREIHIFCDASEQAYGSVAYLRTENAHGNVETAFIMARSRVAPKRQLSIPRLELCAALTGSQLAKLLHTELTIAIKQVVLWSDSTTVLKWIQSDSCRFKVFVGTRVAEIQDLTSNMTWRYVDSANNSADDITRGKPLQLLAGESRWRSGPPFLSHSKASWPTFPELHDKDDSELRGVTFCGLTIQISNSVPKAEEVHSFQQLVELTAAADHGALSPMPSLSADDYKAAELKVLQQTQKDCFPEELHLLQSGKTVPNSSRLVKLAPEYDRDINMIRVGGRLRHSDYLDAQEKHPVVLDGKHPVTKLIIKTFDEKLQHPGQERVFAELRRHYWVIKGREAVKRLQRECVSCQKWRAKPVLPQMADLPPSRLQVYKPPFFSCGVDCFGPFLVKIGRRNEKRWGVLFKCLTTRAVHIDVLTTISTDSFLMALRRFISRRGKPSELLSDCGTNFKGGERELRDAFRDMCPTLQEQLAKQQIKFSFNPPGAPHFGGVWEREIRSIKSSLRVSLGAQTEIPEEVLRTVLIEIEGILNSKPLGYVSSDVADVDPVTPNYLLMGRRDAALPQVIYPESDLLTRRHWRRSQVIAEQFWNHFIKNYLPSLQSRQKWALKTENLHLGTVVMILDKQLPRALWPVGKVVHLFPGADGTVRTAEIQVNDKTYVRPVARLVRLPTIPDEGEHEDN